MGGYLQTPITDKTSDSGEYTYCGRKIMYASTAMQGWRVAMEDAHSVIPDYDDKSSLFAVYDGHGGKEVAVYCSVKLGDIIQSMVAYREGDIDKALKDAFMHFDELLLGPDVIKEMKQIAKNDLAEDSDSAEEDMDELMKEASMPIQSLIARYGAPVSANPTHSDVDASSSGAKGQGTDVRNIFQLLCNNVGIDIEFEDSEEDSQSESESDPSAELDESDVTSDGDSTTPEAAPVQLTSTDPRTDSALTSLLKTTPESNVADNNTTETEQEGRNSAPVAPPISSSAEAPPPRNTSDARQLGGAPSSSTVSVSTAVSPGEQQCTSESSRVGPSNSDTSCDPLRGEIPNTRNPFKPTKSNSLSETDPDDKQSSTPETSQTTSHNLVSNTESSVHSKPIEVSPSSRSLVREESFLDNILEDAKPVSPTKSRGLKELLTTGMEDRYPTDEVAMFLEENDDKEMTYMKPNLLRGSRKRPHPVDYSNDEDALFAPKRPELSNDHGYHSGTTAVVCLLRGRDIFVANSGDSRCVMCSKGKAMELSFDHKPTDPLELERIERAGGKVGKDGRVNRGLNLSRALGDHFYKENTALPLKEQMISSFPDVERAVLDDDAEFIVLACDGIWNSKSSQEVVDFVRCRLLERGGSEPTQKDLVMICEALCDACLARDTDNDGTGCDNMTCILVLLKSLDSSAIAS